MTIYTAISFAPVQGFIEKSRKLRDLFGASLILSYLSQQIAEAAKNSPDCEVISPASINVQEGMPNRILVRGTIDRNQVSNAISQSWKEVLRVCQIWLEENLDFAPEEFHWAQEWEKWHRYTWEVFWGQGETSDAAMLDLERRKLKRDWVGINWTGDSSSLTGTDAIAWHRLGQQNSEPGRSLTHTEKQQLDTFYRQLAWVLDNPDRNRAEDTPSKDEIEGRYIAVNERLSIPELVKRLVTYHVIAKQIGMTPLGESFTEISQKREQWTGWFMGDGDKVGDKLKSIPDDEGQKAFSGAMRDWGRTFKHTFSKELGRVIYAGGDDFLGILYSSELGAKELFSEALKWLNQFKQQWQTHRQDITVSVGLVWAANRVPQRDILQHCREAEKLAKTKGRDRVTIRVVFNSGQFVQWTCPWDYLNILMKYRDRDGGKNWAHLYNDWAHLKSRHAIRSREVNKNKIEPDLALAMLDLYFDGLGQEIQKNRQWTAIAGGNSASAIVQWVEDLVQVGWQLCSNT
ncbi:CRISPR-associated protein Cmr2 [Phormidesmis priestleyi ULC007]|uniref:CRISPR-associated protein Cmr2 n=1 Tax=Phormidesmis priestleyi ULC007 TaxID=1920490 RepID=A0A2T1DLL9_9CYAN|nr:type III-B CRISPR-associated protein Cas10/Cmr2 [Phormidesmis priestleyi]PSB21314.1 CRISPR-associated protein Cmr2 [Phormidesmis priestleyi ULC007]PZO50685.1 MAG: CRISPR-associated protein Cmr2 [Phormidesmis priestleyi]